jgi:hypothetical protein
MSEPAEEPALGTGTGIALGLSLGALAGLTVLDDLGLALGAAFDVLVRRRRPRSRAPALTADAQPRYSRSAGSAS